MDIINDNLLRLMWLQGSLHLWFLRSVQLLTRFLLFSNKTKSYKHTKPEKSTSLQQYKICSTMKSKYPMGKHTPTVQVILSRR